MEKDNEKVILTDDSGDKKYFTQIPNMIVNHSTAYEQSLYLIMKRVAGEFGSCYVSLNFLRKKMGVAKRTVNQTIETLLKREWIEEIDKKKVQGGYVRQFKIIDLWELNLCQYKSGTQMTTSNKSGTPVNGSGTQVTREVEPTCTQRRVNKEDIEEETKNSKNDYENIIACPMCNFAHDPKAECPKKPEDKRTLNL